MPAGMVDSMTVYTAVDGEFTAHKLLFFKKLAIKYDWQLEQYFADYTRDMGLVFGHTKSEESRFVQVAFGKSECDKFWQSRGVEARRFMVDD
jgi:hypothetical protein